MNARLPAVPPPAAEVKWHAEHVTWLHHWTPFLFSFRITRPAGYRFLPGHYARLGLADAAGNIAWRPFSMASGADEDKLEFLVILVAGGEFSSRLVDLKVGDTVLIEKLAYGFLTLDQLAPGDDLWMFASGTGLGPFISILRDGGTWQAFDRLVLAHSVRRGEDLVYRREIEAMRDEALAAGRRARLVYLPTVTREAMPGLLSARIPQLITDGRLEAAAGALLHKTHSRAMVCGNPELVRDMRSLLSARGFTASRRGVPGQMAFEKYW